MSGVSDALAAEFADLSAIPVTQLLVRLLVAGALGALLGREREHHGKPAGLRTLALVAVGSAAFVAVTQQTGAGHDTVTRVIQGLAAGIGFLGAGCISKDGARVYGLTTAAAVWLTAAVGVTAGLGRNGSAILIGGIGWFTLSVLGRLERRLGWGDGNTPGLPVDQTGRPRREESASDLSRPAARP